MRRLGHHPGFTAAAVLTLAVGIAATVTMFTVCWRLVLHPITLPEADTIVSIARVQPATSQVPTSLSWPRVQAIQRDSHAFVAVAAYSNEAVGLSGDEQPPRELRGLRVSAGFFDALRIPAAQGRLFTPDDDLPNGPAVCVLSYETWQARFGGRVVTGSMIRLDGRPTEVVGVLPPRLSAPWADREIFLPRVFDDSQLTPQAVAGGASYLSVVARLAPGVTTAQAVDELRGQSRDYAAQFAGRSDALGGIGVQPLATVVSDGRRAAILFLLGAVVIVLIVACANTAALVLSRLVSRQREIAVRVTLGATHARVIRGLAAEGAALAAVASAGGLLLGGLALSTIGATLAADLPPGIDLRMGTPSVLAACAAMVCATLSVGLLPAVYATRRTSASPVTSFSRGLSYGAGTRRLRTALIVGEVALSTSLLVGTALCLTSLARLHRVPLGFDPDGIAAARVTLPAGAYATPERQQAFFIDVLERLERLPQVSGAAIAFGLPFAADNYVSPYIVAGRPIVPPGERPRAGLRIVTENYLQVMRMRLVTGRFFTASDRTGAPGVCVVNETLARREFAGRSPIGEVLLRGRDADQRFEIVGVVADVKTNGPRQDAPGEVFLPFRQVPRPIGAVTVRSASRPEALAPLLQSVVSAVDPDLPISGFATMDQQINTTIGPDRILAALTSAFGGAALLLAAIGLYAVLAHGVSARTVEIGVRMAVGADRAAILRLIVLGGMRLVATGIAAGLTLAALGARVLEAQLYGISARDPLAYVMVAGLFALVGFTASIVPARRAARVDPIVSLAAS